MKFEVIIEVKSSAVSEKTVKGKDGREYLIREEHGWVDLGKPYPQEVRISLDRGQAPCAAGQYLARQGNIWWISHVSTWIATGQSGVLCDVPHVPGEAVIR